MSLETLTLAPWYLLTVQSNFEDAVQKSLLEKLAEASEELRALVVQVVVPKEKVVAVNNGRSVETERRIYPGYIMVQMNYSESLWHFMKKLKYVKGFLGGAKPSKMKLSEVKDVLGRMEASEDAPKHKVEYEVGQYLRISKGPFTDFNGTIDSVDYEKQRLKVSVTIFGRSTPVDLTFSDVELT
jgi:transcription termination/antitermination protein NusG